MKDPHTIKLGIADDLASDRLKVLGNLAAGAAHELNNWIFVIRGFSELSRLDLPDGHPVTANLDRIEEAVDQAEGLTRLILECAHPSGDGSVSIRLHPLVKEAVKIVREHLSDEIRIHQAIAGDTAAATVDPVRFFPVIMTLLKIAAEPLASDGGELWVSLAEESTAGSTEGSKLALTIGSTIGDDGEEIWRRLATEDTASMSPPRDDEGAAASIREIVEKYGGKLQWRSIDQRGMRMVVSLPGATNVAVL